MNKAAGPGFVNRGQQYGPDKVGDRTINRRSSEKIILGRITGVFGVTGWLKVFAYTDPMESILDYNPWYIRTTYGPARGTAVAKPGGSKPVPWTKVKLKAGKRHAKTVIAKLEHCNDRDAAQAYVGSEIAIEPEQLEKLDASDEFYWHELIGLRVINRQGIELGEVTGLMETGANDVLVVADIEDAAKQGAAKEAKQRLIPWIMHQVVIAVDQQQGILEVDWDPDF